MACSTKEKQLECQRRHYRENKRYYLDRNNRKRKEVADWLDTYKASLCCSRCPENHPATLHFHHVDPTTKIATIAELKTQNVSMKKLQAEIDKCIVLCANCHAKEHWQQCHNS